MHTFQITTDIQRNLVLDVVPRAGVEPARPCGHYALNVARLPFRHLGNLNPILIDASATKSPSRSAGEG